MVTTKVFTLLFFCRSLSRFSLKKLLLIELAQHQSPFKSQENHAHDKDENRAAYIPFPAPATENLKPVFASTPSQPSLSPVQPPAYTSNTVSAIAVDLHVTNLDQSIGAKEMKTLISSVFKQHVMVYFITAFYLTPFS